MAVTYTPGAARGGHDRLIEPAVLARLNNLELIARTAVEGMLIGLHRSPSFGFSQEFAEYRAYMPGDDPRDIDWNVYARTDRTYVKRYFGDTNGRLMMLLDTSASMASLEASTNVICKLDYGRFFAAALVYLAHRQHDAVGLLTFNDRVRQFRPPTSRNAGVRALYHELDSLQPGGGSDWTLPLTRVQSRLRRSGLVVLISDLYTDPDDLAKTLRGLTAIGHDLLLVHLMDPTEEVPVITEATTLRDAETGEVMEVTPAELQSDYPLRLESHITRLRQLTLGMGGHYLRVSTAEPLDRVLAGYLRFRARHP